MFVFLLLFFFLFFFTVLLVWLVDLGLALVFSGSLEILKALCHALNLVIDIVMLHASTYSFYLLFL